MNEVLIDWTRWDASSDPVEDVRRAFEQIVNAPPRIRDPAIAVSPDMFKRLQYWNASDVIRSWPGYEKWRGPDGKEWIEDRRDSDDRNGVYRFGSGNRAKRRIGMDPQAIRDWDDGGYMSGDRPEPYHAPWEKNNF